MRAALVIAFALLAPTAKGDRCKVDSDCIIARADCCGCSQGGKQEAIAKSRAKAHAARMLERCGKIVTCVQVMSNDPSCHMVPACVAKHCTLVPPK